MIYDVFGRFRVYYCVVQYKASFFPDKFHAKRPLSKKKKGYIEKLHQEFCIVTFFF